jgi:hypothetical protein
MSSSVFEHLSKLITVKDLANRLGPTLRAEMASHEAVEELIESAIEDLDDPMARISLVKDGKLTVGWTAFDILGGEADEPISYELISPDTFLTSTTTAFEAARLFATTTWHFFFVLENNEITGTLHFADLYKLPFRLSLFSLTLQIEEAAIDLILPDIGDAWKSLPEGRKQSARAVYQKRYGQPPDERRCIGELLLSTMFCDKGTMIRKRKLASWATGGDVDRFFSKAEQIRNACAHPGGEDDLRLNPTELQRFIDDAHRWIEFMVAATETAHGGMH